MFVPGVRLYFDRHRIIRDGLGTRDGSHTLKAHHRLPLQPYLIAAVCSSDLEPHVSKRRWTIKSFVEQANETFQKQVMKSFCEMSRGPAARAAGPLLFYCPACRISA